VTFDYNVAPTPEPSTLARAGLGGLGLLLFRRRK
jgi:MYXO-CTERM domain-containing protein